MDKQELRTTNKHVCPCFNNNLTESIFPQKISYPDLKSIKYIKKDPQNFPLKSTKL